MATTKKRNVKNAHQGFNVLHLYNQQSENPDTLHLLPPETEQSTRILHVGSWNQQKFQKQKLDYQKGRRLICYN